MAEIRANLESLASPGMTGGAAAITGTGGIWEITYGGSVPAAGSRIAITITDVLSSLQVQVGATDTVGIIPVYVFTHSGKLYILAGSTVFFSELDSPTNFRTIEGEGNGFVTLSNQVQTPEDVIAQMTFQGRMAFFSRQSVQLWDTPVDPAQWQLIQTLKGIGTLAKNSVQAKGDLDILFLSDTGIRSLRARESSLNAFVDDIGSPIDSLIQTKILGFPLDAVLATSIVEPTTGQYWVFIKDTIYALSYFPSSKVAAWSVFEPKDSNGDTFVPSKFVVYKGKVYTLGVNRVYRYGGSDGNTYDSTVATVELPWNDLQTPGIIKHAVALNAAYTGNWSIQVGMDPVSGTLEPVAWSGTAHTFDKGRISVSGKGSHFKAKMVSTGTGAMTFSSLSFHFTKGSDT